MAYVALCHDTEALLDAFRGPKFIDLASEPCHGTGPSCGQIAKPRESNQSDYGCYSYNEDSDSQDTMS